MPTTNTPTTVPERETRPTFVAGPYVIRADASKDCSCHRDTAQADPERLVLLFDRLEDESLVVAHLTTAYGPGHECANARRRMHTWRSGQRELALCADADRLTLLVERSA